MSVTTRASQPPAPPADSPVHWAIRWAFYLFVLSLPFEYPRRSIPWEVTTITCAVFLLAALFQPWICFRRFPGALWWFAGFLYVFLVSFVVNGGFYGDAVQKLFILLVQVLLLLWAGYNVLRDDEVFRSTPVVLAVACVARALIQVLGIATVRSAEWGGGVRVSALGQNANQSAVIMTDGLIALIGLGYGGSTRWRRGRALIWPIAGLVGVAIIQNGSRGAVIALALGVMMFALAGSGLWSRLKNATLVLVVLTLLIWGSYNSEGMRNRFEEAVSTGYMAGREQIYPELMQMFVERPILGYGPIANQYVLGGRLPQQHYDKRDAHNLFLEVMTSTGTVGMVPFMLLLWFGCRAAWRARRGPAGLLPLALLVSALGANMTGNWLAGPMVWLEFAYALASDREGSRQC